MSKSSIRTPLARVRHLGAAHSGTEHFWKQRVSSVALVMLTVVFIAIVIGLIGRNHAAAAQILGSPFVAITMMMFVITSAYHMWLGMQVIIEDYVHSNLKLTLIMLSTFFCFAVGLSSLYALVKLSFGV
jgi:succinate dehydrogenase / fumarate reductase membrane anchor subunit